jgi:protein-tyrosine-phosphatase
MRTIVFVCSGNTCRSPLALAAWRSLQAQGKAPTDVKAVSAGTLAGAGLPAAKHSVALAQEWGDDLTTHESQPLSDELIESSSAFFVMSYDQAFALREYFQLPEGKVHLLGAYDPTAESGEEHEIFDPYGGSREAYETCAAKILRSAEGVAKAMEKGEL